MPNIHLEYLPGSSPDYNLIELVWHSAKEYIANRLFRSIEELEVLLHKLLNEGGLVSNGDENLKTKEMPLSQFKCETAYCIPSHRSADWPKH